MKVSLSIVALPLAILLLTSCSKDDSNCDAGSEFCEALNKNDQKLVGILIDDYLKSNTTNDSDESLQRLEDWLECKECVSNVKLLCNSCIETFPPQSELEMKAEINAETHKVTMDILMGDPMTFAGYHE